MTERPFMPVDLAIRDDQKVGALEQENPAFVTLFIYLLILQNQEKGPLDRNYKRLAYLLRFPSEEDVRHVVEDFGLFALDDDRFWSVSAMERMERKEEVANQRREAGLASGRARRGNTPVERPAEQTPNDRSNGVQTPVERPAELSNQINQINQIKSLSECAGAGAPTHEKDDLIFINFFFKNFKKPGYETDRCIKNYAGQDVKSWPAVLKKWTPEDTTPRFSDPRALQWAKLLYDTVADCADTAEATEILRHIDAIDIDKGRNELKVRMRGGDWREAVETIVADNDSLRAGFDKVIVTKRIDT